MSSPRQRHDLRLIPAALMTWAIMGWITAGYGWVELRGLHIAALGTVIIVFTAALHPALTPRVPPARRTALRGSLTLLTGICIITAALGLTHATARTDAHLDALATGGETVAVTATISADARALRTSFNPELARWRIPITAHTIATAEQRIDGHIPMTLIANAPRTGAPATRAECDSTTTNHWACLDVGSAITLQAIITTDGPHRGRYYTLTTEDPAHVEDSPAWWWSVSNTLRDGLLAITTDLSPQGQGLVPGIAIGDTSAMPPDLDDAMKTVSLTHITAVSGAHFAIMSTLLLLICAASRLPRPVTILLVASAMSGFVLLVRPEASVLRAAAMGAVGLVALAVKRPSSSLPALATAVIVLLMFDPWLARSYGFGLSALATAGLVVLTGPIARRLPRLPTWLAHAIAIPAAAQLACGPLIIMLSPHISAYAVLANILAAPLVVAPTILGVGASLMAQISPTTAHLMVQGAEFFTGGIAHIAYFTAALPGASLPWFSGVIGTALLTILHVALAAWLIHRDMKPGHKTYTEQWTWQTIRHRFDHAHRRWQTAIIASALILSATTLTWGTRTITEYVAGDANQTWDVAVCDVGQGTALAIRTSPDAAPIRAILIDTGPDPQEMTHCLNQLNITHIELLVISHLHADHVGGAQSVIGQVPVDAVLTSPLGEPSHAHQHLKNLTAEARVPLVEATAGMSGPGWEVLWPSPGFLAGYRDAEGSHFSPSNADINDTSLAMAIEVGGLRIVTLGDLEDAGQRELLEYLSQEQWFTDENGAAGGGSGDGRAGTAGRVDGGSQVDRDGRVDIGHVAHHGSATQSEALAKYLRPRLSLISAGRGNDHGHPTERALDLYHRFGPVISTHVCGLMRVTANAGQMQVHAEHAEQAECQAMTHR